MNIENLLILNHKCNGFLTTIQYLHFRWVYCYCEKILWLLNLEKAVEGYYDGLLHWNLRISWPFLSSPYGWIRFHLKTAKKTLNFSTLDHLATPPTAFSRLK